MLTQINKLLKRIGAFGLVLLFTFPAIGHQMPPPNIEKGDRVLDNIFCQGDEGLIVLESWMKTAAKFGEVGLREYYFETIKRSNVCMTLDQPFPVIFDGCVVLGHNGKQHFCIYKLGVKLKEIVSKESQYYGIVWEPEEKEQGRLV